jgi:polysaccharide deacetylase family protein (PEP-CTERM system associated)
MESPRIISVDVEDYFQVEAFSNVISRDSWEQYPSRVEANTRRLLDLFDEAGARGTFFILGWVAERFPRLVREIADRGHEIGSHSYWHRLIYKLTPEEFRADTIRARDCIEQAAGQPIIGYRAPSFSIVSKSVWALDILCETGIRYDSSVFPVRHDTYGIPEAPRGPFQIMTSSGPIVEFPLATFRVGKSPNLPVGGGGYLRMLPFWYTRFGLNRMTKEGLPVICYIHPWEVDPGQPRIVASLRSRVRHYTNLSKAASRLKALLKGQRYTSFRESGLVETPQSQLVKL